MTGSLQKGGFFKICLCAATFMLAEQACAQGTGAPTLPSINPPQLFGAQTNQESALPDVGADTNRSPGLGLALPQGMGASQEPALGGVFSSLQEDQRTPEQIEKEVRTEAFKAAITGLLPLKPEEIRKLLEEFDKTQEAVAKPVYPNPKPLIDVETVSLDPGAKPPELKTAKGNVSTLSLLDITGAPWAIQDMSWAGDFDVSQVSSGDNVLRVTPLSEFAYGNLSVRLVGLKTPVVFMMTTNRDVVQYRLDARIPEYGPQASPPPIDGGVTLVAGGSALNAILDGVPPEGAEKMAVSGVDGRTTVYNYNGLTYVRSPLTLLSPGWSSSVSSADGMRVYTVTEAPVLLLSDRGRMVRARLSKEDASNE